MQVLRYGGSTSIVSRRGVDAQVRMPAGMTATVRDFTGRRAGKPKRFGPFAASGAQID